MNILRDAAHLQTQLRLFDSLVETRHTILKLRPTLRQHWIALTVAYHLNGNLSEAKRTLEHYEKMEGQAIEKINKKIKEKEIKEVYIIGPLEPVTQMENKEPEGNNKISVSIFGIDNTLDIFIRMIEQIIAE